MTERFEWFRDLTPRVPHAERVVLDKWNGRPTLAVDLYEQGIVLRWLLLGQVEPFDVWLTLPITSAEAEELIQHTPKGLVDWISHRKGRPVLVRLDRFGSKSDKPITVAQESWVVPGDVNVVSEALLVMNDAVKAQFGQAPRDTSPEDLERILDLLRPVLPA